MRLLSRLEQWSLESSESVALLAPESPCFENGALVPLWGVELMAQAAAAGVAYGAMASGDQGRACFGMVVGLDDYEALGSPDPRPGDEIRILTERVAEVPPAAEHEARLMLRGSLWARGRIRMIVGDQRPNAPGGSSTPAEETLLGSEVSVLEREEARISARVVVGPRHPYLQGHFPGLPLLPAVGQLRFVEHLLGVALGAPRRLRAIRRARFLEPVGPGVSLELTVELSGPQASWALKAGARLASRGTVAI
jgi:3-hydroxymyristoyl/3-hydroxydecanoyl-(acyl carrier protein) dehydratase